MKLDAILGADMTTVKLWFLNGFRWWVSQLRELVPDRWLTAAKSNETVALFDGENAFSYVCAGRKIAKPIRQDQRIALSIPEQFSLTRTLTVPRIGLSDIRRMVEFEAERLMPLPLDEILIDIDPEPRNDNPHTLSVAVAMLPCSVAQRAVEAAAAVRIVPTAIMLSRTLDGGTARFDFAPLLRARGLLPARPPAAAIWWGLVGFAFLINLILLVIRDQQTVNQMAGLVDQQAPAVATARIMESRVGQFEANAQLLVARRRTHDALGALGVASTALPAAAWVQRYSWNGNTLRLTGYKQQNVDVIAALRRRPEFVSVRPASSDVTAAIPAGQPFDVIAVMQRRGR